jgi:transcriptional regulator with XRE-family HTH domain
MATTVEERAAALLAALLAERGTTAAQVAAGLGVEPAAVERLLAGREPLELARLERVLGVLGASPAAFFARLYGGGPVPADTGAAAAVPPETAAAGAPPAGGTDEPVTRREVEEVLGTLRAMIDGMVRMLDSERAADRAGGDGPGEGGSGSGP